MSHLIKEKTLFSDLDVLKECVEKQGCTWIGARESVHVFNTDIAGTAFHVPGMEYPVVVTPDGEMVYETHNGPCRRLKRVMQEYTFQKIIDGASSIHAEDIRKWIDENGVLHVDMKKGDKLLKFQIGEGGRIKAVAEGYPENGCYSDINSVIGERATTETKKERKKVYAD